MRIALVLFVTLTLAGCASSRVKRPEPSGPSNVVAFAGPTLGSEKQELYVNHCHSGENRGFSGADMFDDRTKEVLVLRLVIDPLEGPAVRLFKESESGPSVVLRKSDCRTFKYTMEGTGRLVNFVPEVRVSLQLDCRGSKGDYVVGNVELPACL